MITPIIPVTINVGKKILRSNDSAHDNTDKFCNETAWSFSKDSYSYVITKEFLYRMSGTFDGH